MYATIIVIILILVLVVVVCILGTIDMTCNPFLPICDSVRIGSVDMVVAWAGRTTPERDTARRKYLSLARPTHERVLVDASDTRYAYNGELPILIRRAFAYGTPWLRYIHIVMPDECTAPDDLIHEALGDMYDTLGPRVYVHRDSVILPATAIPSFSSHPKEANLDRIPGLSEQFVYANDDMFLNRPTPVGLFFDTGGQPRYRMDSSQPICSRYDQHLVCSGHHLIVYDWIQHNTASIFWTAPIVNNNPRSYQCLQLEHQMKPLTRSGYHRARAMFPSAFAHLTNQRFRSRDDFSPTILIPNLEIVGGNAKLDTQTPMAHQICLSLDMLPRMKRNFLISIGRLSQCYLICLNNADREWHAEWISHNFNIDPLVIPADTLT
jgi:hypothetical protein